MLRDRYGAEVEALDDEDSVVLGDRCVCVCVPSDKVGVNDVRTCVTRWPEAQTVVIIAEGGATHFVARKLLDREPMFPEAEGHDIQVLTSASMRFNVTEHVLVPRHRPIDTEAAATLCAKYGFESIDVLPTIKITDPVVVYLNLSLGDVVEITRDEIGDNGLAVRSVAYRRVRK
jgi:DNA-directed RNA polymerase subunit H (RpoH/RPB5)